MELPEQDTYDIVQLFIDTMKEQKKRSKSMAMDSHKQEVIQNFIGDVEEELTKKLKEEGYIEKSKEIPEYDIETLR